MIHGIGVDILRVDRVAAVYAKFPERFPRRLLMPEEWPAFEATRHKLRFLAMRFAAKEAIVKALGTGFAHGMWLRDSGIMADPRGRPEVIFSARGTGVCEAMGAGAGHVTLTDEAGLIVAVAVLMRATP
jgi:holo-[acyl-carrier protein] synthase